MSSRPPRPSRARRPRSPRGRLGLWPVIALLVVALVVVLVVSHRDGTDAVATAGAETAESPVATKTDSAGSTATSSKSHTKSPAPSTRTAAGVALPATAANGLRCRPRTGEGPIVRTGSRTAGRRIALTFDDGPSIYTGRVLDDLQRAKVRATFFVIGRQVTPNRNLVRRIVTDGHALGSHTWSHANVSAGDAQTDSQMNDTQYAIQQAVGRAGCLMRPPGGAVGPGLERWLTKHQKLAVLWDVDSNDYKKPTAAAMVREIVAETRPGSIILLHDGGGDRTQTIAAVPGIIKGLKARNFEFVTVPELLRLPKAR